MRKNTDVTQTRKELYENFQKTRGAIAAFCRKKNITGEWMRLVFKGEYDDLDLLIDAADFLKQFRADMEAERTRKSEILSGKVAELLSAQLQQA